MRRALLPLSLMLLAFGWITASLYAQPTPPPNPLDLVRVNTPIGYDGSAAPAFQGAITILPETLPNGQPNVPYQAQLSATGGIAPYTFDLIAGNFPTQLNFSSDGVISGTVTGVGSAQFTVRAIDANGSSGTRQYTITFQVGGGGALTLSPETLPPGQVNAPYNATITASGGTAPYTFTLVGGAFPTELTFNSNGTITGTVTGVGSATFTVQATDAAGNTGTRQYTITFTVSGEAPTATPLPPTVTPTPDRADLLREQLGPPRLIIPEESGITAQAVRTGPMVGASLITTLFIEREYNIVGKYKPSYSRYTWYLVEYPITPNPVPEGSPLVRAGWTSGRFVELRGYLPDIPTVGNPFDSVPAGSTNVTAISPFKGNLYRYPAGNAPLIGRFDEGASFTVLGRTVLDQRQGTYWIYVRDVRTGSTGWTRWTVFFEVDGNLAAVPQY